MPNSNKTKTDSHWAVRQIDQSPSIVLEGFKMYRVLEGSGFEGMGCEYVVLEPGKILEPHIHQYSHSIIFVVSGSGFALVDGQRYALRENSIINIPPGTEHGLEAGDADLVVYGFQHPAIIHDNDDADIYFVQDGRKAKIS